MDVDKDQQHQQKQQPVQRNLLASTSGPLLVYMHGKKGKSQNFFSLSENRYQVKNIPEMREKRLLRCSHGWLLLVDSKDEGEDCFLLNPISMQKIQLPPWVCKCFYQWGVLSLPPDNPKCIVMFVGDNDFGIIHFMFCKPGDIKWTRYDLKLHDDHFPTPRAIGIHNGEIYLLMYRDYDKLYVVRINENSQVVLSDLEIDHRSFWVMSSSETYFVEICGEFFRVEKSSFRNNVIGIRVFKLDLDKKVWVKIIRMEDQAIFLGSYGTALAYPTKESSGIRGNTIYFTQRNDRSLYMYNLELGNIDVYLPCSNVKHDWSQPTWILPVRAREDK